MLGSRYLLIVSDDGAEGVTELIVLFVGLVFVIPVLIFLALLAHGDAMSYARGFLDRRSESHVDAVADRNHAVILGILSVLQQFNCGVQHVCEGRFRGFLFRHDKVSFKGCLVSLPIGNWPVHRSQRWNGVGVVGLF